MRRFPLGEFFLRGLQIDPLCPHCHIEIEDVEHLFLGCPVVNHVWMLAKDHNWITINISSDPHQSVQNWLASLRLYNLLLKLDRIVSLFWSIRKTRNNTIFRNESSNPVITLLRTKRASAEWRIRHTLSQSLHPLHLSFSTNNHKQSYWVA